MRNKWILAAVSFSLMFWIILILVIYSFVENCTDNQKNDEVEKTEDFQNEENTKEIIVDSPINDSDLFYVKENKTETFIITAYCPCYECSKGYGNMTATGKRAVEGRTIAVDPDIVPYGTELYIDGIGYRIAEDCGAFVKGKHIDIYFDCHSKVDAFGKKYAEVEI